MTGALKARGLLLNVAGSCSHVQQQPPGQNKNDKDIHA
jgi:hypothetical protein